MAWYILDPNDGYNGDETEEQRVEWLADFTRWIEQTFDGRSSRYDRSPCTTLKGLRTYGSLPIPNEVIGDLFEYWYENILSMR